MGQAADCLTRKRPGETARKVVAKVGKSFLAGWEHWSRLEEMPPVQEVQLAVPVEQAKSMEQAKSAEQARSAERWGLSMRNPRFFATLWNLRGSMDPKIEEKSDNDNRFDRCEPDYSTFGSLGKMLSLQGIFGPPQGCAPESKSNVFRCSFCLVGEVEQRYNPHPYELNIKSGSGEP